VDVSVIIVGYNTRDMLRDCLRSVGEQGEACAFETIVVDNASSDGSAAMIAEEFSHAVVRLLANDTNRGFAAACNQGLAEASGRYALLLNPDTVVLEGCFEKTVAFADAHAGAAVVGCRVLNPDRTLQPTCFRFPSLLNLLLAATHLYKLFPRSRLFGRERMGSWRRDDVRDVDVVTGCFMLVRREAIEQVGPMDERFFMYAEETDWCYRFRQAGRRNLFMPHDGIVHLGGASTSTRSGEMNLALRGSILQFFGKHRSPAATLAARLLTCLFYALRAPVWGVAALVRRGRKRREAADRWRTYVRGAWMSLTGRLGSPPTYMTLRDRGAHGNELRP